MKTLNMPLELLSFASSLAMLSTTFFAFYWALAHLKTFIYKWDILCKYNTLPSDDDLYIMSIISNTQVPGLPELKNICVPELSYNIVTNKHHKFINESELLLDETFLMLPFLKFEASSLNMMIIYCNGWSTTCPYVMNTILL